MKAPRFAYRKAASIDEAFAALAEHGEEAKLLAGGQSLIPSLNMRLSEPRLLVDINGIDALEGIAVEDGTVRIGALVRHAELGRSPAVARMLPLLHQAVPHIAHPAIRNRGTFGGSIAFADPAAELPACAVALGAELLLGSRRGTRRVLAADFFHGLYETALAADEIVLGAAFAAAKEGERSVFLELTRRRGDYAMAGLAAHGSFDGPAATSLRLVFFGVDTKPVMAAGAARAACGGSLAERIAVAEAALDDDLDPPPDLHGSRSFKRHLARVLLRRALTALAAPEGRA